MKKLSWFDRLLIKIAVAKSAAHQGIDVRFLSSLLVDAFQKVNSVK